MKEKLKQISEVVWELPKGTIEGMNVPARIMLSKKMMDAVEEGAMKQIVNVATLPGIYKHSIAMPDMHYGYGFPIGGVAALDIKEGGVSPGGIGFDINCGVRVLSSNLTIGEVRPKIKEIIETIFRNVPAGVGKSGKLKLSKEELKKVLEKGAGWAIDNGFGRPEDLEHTESNGCIKEADASKVSERAITRGAPQIGTLGAGNHFIEVQRVAEIYEPETAKVFGINKVDQICFMIHTGSRGLGHQVCSDYLQILNNKFSDLVSKLPDRDLVYAPAGTQECEDYFSAMACAANFAWTNRQMIMHWVRKSVAEVMGKPEEDMDMNLIYDVAHNIGKIEQHNIDGEEKTVYMHRKGATRCFGPGHPELPEDYRKVGQPAIVPGDMGTASYILVGTEKAEIETFSSVCHGAGRVMSRSAAIRKFRGEDVKKQLAEKGIYAKGASWKGMAEEAPGVYKDIHEVVNVCQTAGISRKIVRLEPVGVMKG